MHFQREEGADQLRVNDDNQKKSGEESISADQNDIRLASDIQSFSIQESLQFKMIHTAPLTPSFFVACLLSSNETNRCI